jgi:hypothetical protein
MPTLVFRLFEAHLSVADLDRRWRSIATGLDSNWRK